MIKHFKKIAAVVALSGMSSMAFAQYDCTSAISSFQSCLGDSVCEAHIISEFAGCFPGSSADSTTVINATSFAQATAASRAVASRFNVLSGGPLLTSAKTTGLAAGGMTEKWNIWGNVDQNNTDYRYRLQTGLNPYITGSNDVTTSIIGVDYALSPQMVAGVSAAFDNSKARGTNNGAQVSASGTDGYQIAPYIGYQLSTELALDASVGFGKADFADGSNTVKAKGDRWFAAANLTYAKWMGNLQYTGKASYLHGEERYDNYTNAGAAVAGTGTTNKLDQFRFGAQAAYWMNGFMPFAGLTYTTDATRSSSVGGANLLGSDAWVWSLGVNFFSLSSKVTGGVMYQVETNRTHSENDVLTANINFRF